MKTDDLIHLLAEDAPVGRSLTYTISVAVVSGTFISMAILLVTIGIRSNIFDVIHTMRVVFKIGLTLALAVTAGNLVFKVGKPGVPLKGAAIGLSLCILVLAAGIAGELSVTPLAQWYGAMVGRNSTYCLFYIPLLSLAPLVALLWALKGGAPEYPSLAGTAAGLAAGGIGAAIYAWHYPDDSPLFVASWYVIAIASVTICGGLAGRSLLRW